MPSSMILNAKSIREALDKISSALGNEFTNVSVRFKDGEGLQLAAATSSIALQITTLGSTGRGKFSISAESFQKILANRSELECQLKDSKLMFRSKKSDRAYQGELLIFPHAPVKVSPGSDGDDDTAIRIPMGSDVLKHFNTARNRLKLAQITDPNREGLLCVKVEKGRMVAVAFDDCHAGIYEVLIDHKGEVINFNLPDSTLRKILSITKTEENYSLLIGKNSVFIESENIKASMTMTAIEENRVDLLLNMVRNLKAEIKTSTQGDAASITNVVNNMMSVFESDKAVTIKINKQLEMLYSTAYGRVSETFKTKVKGPEATLFCTPDALLDIVNLFPEGQITIGIHVDKHESGRTISKGVFSMENLTYTIMGV